MLLSSSVMLCMSLADVPSKQHHIASRSQPREADLAIRDGGDLVSFLASRSASRGSPRDLPCTTHKRRHADNEQLRQIFGTQMP